MIYFAKWIFCPDSELFTIIKKFVFFLSPSHVCWKKINNDNINRQVFIFFLLFRFVDKMANTPSDNQLADYKKSHVRNGFLSIRSKEFCDFIRIENWTIDNRLWSTTWWTFECDNSGTTRTIITFGFSVYWRCSTIWSRTSTRTCRSCKRVNVN